MNKDAPVVRFARGGREAVSGRSWDSPISVLHGASGLGVAPVEIAKAPRLAGDGSVVRGVRFADRELFVPLRLQAPTMADLHVLRRELTRVVAPTSGDPAGSRTTVTFEDPATGTVRSIFGVYREGLEGELGESFHNTWQTIGLVFDCPDPWWMGEDRTTSLQLGGDTKPFLSDTVDFFPVTLSASVVQGDLTIHIDGDADVWPVWEITGPGEDLVIESPQGRIQVDGVFDAGDVLRIDTRQGRMVPDRWSDTSLDSRLFPLHVGSNHLSITMVGATPDTMVRLVWAERWLEAV